MTSKPASRSALATTFAPRSCPSRPGFAIRIRIGACNSYDDRLAELAELRPQHVGHLANRAVGLRALGQVRHQIRGSLGRRAQLLEGARRGRRVALGPDSPNALDLPAALLLVDLVELDVPRLLPAVLVHADDDALAGLELPLLLIGPLGDQRLDVARLDRVHHPAELVDLV